MVVEEEKPKGNLFSFQILSKLDQKKRKADLEELYNNAKDDDIQLPDGEADEEKGSSSSDSDEDG